MTESDDIEEFITCLEITLRSAGTQRSKWKHSLLTRLTQKAKQAILRMLEDDSVGYEEIKEALVNRNITTAVAASKAFFSFNNNQVIDKPILEIIVKLSRWGSKIQDDSETPTQTKNKFVMGVMRSRFVPELEQFLDIKEPKTISEFEALVKQWELTQLYKHMPKTSGTCANRAP